MVRSGVGCVAVVAAILVALVVGLAVDAGLALAIHAAFPGVAFSQAFVVIIVVSFLLAGVRGSRS